MDYTVLQLRIDAITFLDESPQPTATPNSTRWWQINTAITYKLSAKSASFSANGMILQKIKIKRQNDECSRLPVETFLNAYLAYLCQVKLHQTQLQWHKSPTTAVTGNAIYHISSIFAKQSVLINVRNPNKTQKVTWEL